MSNKEQERIIMLLMAKRGRKPKHGTPDEDGRTGIPVNFRMDPDLFDALEEFIAAQKFKTTKTDVIEVALQELLKGANFFPRKKKKPESDT